MTNILWHNPLAEMYGPHFLAFYTIVAIVVLFFCAWRVRWRETPRDASPFHPERLDPYELAYLRGREAEVIRVAAFSLVQQGYLEAATRKTPGRTAQVLAETPAHPDPSELPDLERAVLAAVADSGFQCGGGSSALKEAVAPYCRDCHRRLQGENLIIEADREQDAWMTKWLAASVLAALAVYKLTAAILNGHTNVAFLILLTAAALLGAHLVCTLPRQTARGKSYLRGLSSKLQNHTDLTALEAPLSQAAMLVLAGVFGMSILKDTAYASVYEAFEFESNRQSASSSAGGCGGGGGGCGGGGCGGGCGGCGGCGG